MSRRSRHVPALVVAALAACVLATSGGADTIFSSTVFFRITYRPDCTFAAQIDGGITLDSANGTGATLPPGPYQISVRTPLPDDQWYGSPCTSARFSMSGPGVSYAAALGTDLGPYGSTFVATLQPSSTYTLVEASRPSQPVAVTTTATGTSTQLLPPPPAPLPYVAESQSELVGSGNAPYRGAITATVDSTGVVALSLGGKPISSSLQAGAYDLVVHDASGSAGLFVQKGSHVARSVSGTTFRGTRKVRLTLSAGGWSFYAVAAKPQQVAVSG